MTRKPEIDRVDPTERSLQARWAAHSSWASTPDRSARTAPARKAALDRFDRLVDPDLRLAPEVRSKRAAKARSSYFRALAAKSALVRARKKTGGE